MQSLHKTLLILCGLTFSPFVAATEFDQYLQKEKILDDRFKIIDAKKMNDLLTVLSAEDSRTLPLQIDQNTIIEKLQLSADKTQLEGLISTPDFAQFEQDLGKKDVHNMIRRNLIQNCEILFEHQYQRVNPYRVHFNLSSKHHQYKLELSAKDCSF